ncbi:hypothetical protein Tco_1080004 [Tanacetum coccineum]|uniref:Uncharacterized protein n=1 Tax=Tanacetum coccineum TaxID=301880 RepID=A0ABQ5HUD2_9ASTR
MYKLDTKKTQTRITRLPQDFKKTNKRVSFSTGVIATTSVSRLQLKSNQLEDRVLHNNSEVKAKEVEEHHRNSKFSKLKMSVTACNDSLNVKTLNGNFVCVTCGKCVLNENHDLCVLHYINGVNNRTKQPIAVPISANEPKEIVNQSVGTSLKKTVALESTNKKPRKSIRKLHEHASKTCNWLVPSCFVIFDLELLSLSFDFVFSSEISKSFPCFVFNDFAILRSSALAVLVTGASQSRQHESRKSSTKSLFDDDSSRISIVTVNTIKYHSDVVAKS